METNIRTGLVIADFEMSYTTSFIHTALVKWNVDFANSNITEIQDNLNKLHHNVKNGVYNKVHVGYELTLQDVERVQHLIETLITRYEEKCTLYLPRKIYHLINQLTEAEKETPQDIVREIFAPKLTPYLSKKAEKEANVDALQQQRLLEMIRKRNKRT